MGERGGCVRGRVRLMMGGWITWYFHCRGARPGMGDISTLTSSATSNLHTLKAVTFNPKNYPIPFCENGYLFKMYPGLSRERWTAWLFWVAHLSWQRGKLKSRVSRACGCRGNGTVCFLGKDGDGGRLSVAMPRCPTKAWQRQMSRVAFWRQRCGSVWRLHTRSEPPGHRRHPSFHAPAPPDSSHHRPRLPSIVSPTDRTPSS